MIDAINDYFYVDLLLAPDSNVLFNKGLGSSKHLWVTVTYIAERANFQNDSRIFQTKVFTSF